MARLFSLPLLASPHKTTRAGLRFICSDMWKPYLKVIPKKAGQGIHILDPFHIMGHFGKAIDEVRAQEARKLRARGRAPVLTKTRWLLLKRPENLTEKQEVRLADLLRYNLRSVRSYAQGGLPVLLGLPLALLGRVLPRPMAHAHDAIEDRTDEARRPHVVGPSTAYPQLVPNQRPALERRGRGLQR